MALKIKSYNRISTDKKEALKDVMVEKMVTLTVLVPQSLRDNVKIKAIQNKTKVTNIILDYLKEYIDK